MPGDGCRDHATTTEVRTSRLCVACGGGDTPEALVAIGQRGR